MHPAASFAAPVVRLPGLARLDAFNVAGPSRRFDPASTAGIPGLWAELAAALPIPDQRPGRAAYGLIWDEDRAAGSFRYLAGVRTEPACALPPGFALKQVPAAAYAVFRITLDGSAVHPQIKAAMAAIRGRLLPESGLAVADGPCFELHDGRAAVDAPGAVIDFHVPVDA